jgi:hypothetical protein
VLQNACNKADFRRAYKYLVLPIAVVGVSLLNKIRVPVPRRTKLQNIIDRRLEFMKEYYDIPQSTIQGIFSKVYWFVSSQILNRLSRLPNDANIMTYNSSSSSSSCSSCAGYTLPELVRRTTTGDDVSLLNAAQLIPASRLSGRRSAGDRSASCLEIIDAALKIMELDDEELFMSSPSAQ